MTSHMQFLTIFDPLPIVKRLITETLILSSQNQLPLTKNHDIIYGRPQVSEEFERPLQQEMTVILKLIEWINL